MKRNFTALLIAILVVLQIIFISWKSHGQAGCTDPQATNYNAAATLNDGSCLYPTTNIALADKTALSTPLLDETSGVVFTNGSIWTHNDSGNSNTIYRIDSTSNTILQSVIISNATNVDWEDITADSNYIYVADCGNNNGNRTNLKIYRVAKSSLIPTATTVIADIINYSYSDQTVFTTLPNNNNYDCESVFFYKDSLHLLSKNWVNKQTKHYVLPRTPGTQIAQVKETLNVGFLVTGASIQQNGVIALIGYDNAGVAPIYLYMLYDHSGGLFFNGNKRRFNASNALSYGQVEAIDFRNGAYGYITNERFIQSIFNVAPKLRAFNLTPYLPSTIFAPAPVAGFTQNKDSVCPGSIIQFTDASLNQPTSWQWSFPGGIPFSSTLQNPTVTYSTPGTYDAILTVSNAIGTNTKTKTSAVIVNTVPTAIITANGPTQFCVGGKVTLTASTGTGYLYQWKKGTTNLVNAINPTYIAKTTGNFSVVITNAQNCSKQSNAISVTGPPTSTITVTGSLNVCNGDSVRLRGTAGAGYTYQWQKNNVNIVGATLQTYYGKTAGSYRVSLTDSYGCSKYSGVKTVTTNCPSARIAESAAPFTIYPNPFTESFIIEMDETLDATFSILDITGKEVIALHQLEANESIAIGTHLKPGIYFIRISTEEKAWVTRVIKTK
jgi:hypothetical protein